jgi:hypothetical protein
MGMRVAKLITLAVFGSIACFPPPGSAQKTLHDLLERGGKKSAISLFRGMGNVVLSP